MSNPQAAPVASLSSASLSFSNQVVNTASVATLFTLTNSGSAVLTIANVAVSGDFAQSNTCGMSLAVAATCTLAVTFTPTSAGTRSGALSIADNASGSPQQITLSGAGVVPGQLAASPGNVAFGNVTVGQSATQAVSLSNTGGDSITVGSASTNGSGFSASGLQLPLTLNPGQNSVFSVTFSPSNTGTAAGTIDLTPSGGAPVAVVLSGTGADAPQHSVALQWNASTSSIVGYYIYRGAQTGGPYARLDVSPVAATAYTDPTVQAGQSYFYVVTAVDANNVESGYSNEAAALVPAL